jgi:hypothetical protein
MPRLPLNAHAAAAGWRSSRRSRLAVRPAISRPRPPAPSGSTPHDPDHTGIDRHDRAFKLRVRDQQRRGSTSTSLGGIAQTPINIRSGPSRCRPPLQSVLQRSLSASLSVAPALRRTLQANQFPIARAARSGAPFPAVSFLAGFRTPALIRVERPSWPASETNHRSGPSPQDLASRSNYHQVLRYKHQYITLVRSALLLTVDAKPPT